MALTRQAQMFAAAVIVVVCLSRIHSVEVEAFSPAGPCNFVSTVAPLHHRRNSNTRIFQSPSSSMLESSSDTRVPSLELAAPQSILITPTPSSSAKTIDSNTEQIEKVPSTWAHALHRFFIGDVGPPLVLLTISTFLYTRLQLPTTPFTITETTIFISSILFWWVQEYFFHRVLLHSPFNWLGKSIHQTHHDKDYFHVSIDPPELLLGWLFTAHFILRAILPWNLCLSATIGYACAGLVYEWSHYIVHTKVKPPSTQQQQQQSSKVIQILSRLFSQMRDNHVRHHRVDDRYWYAFSVPAMDDLFDTNPSVKDVRREAESKDEM